MADLSPQANASANGDAGADDKPDAMPAYTWYVILLLAMVYAVHTMDRGVLAILLEPIGKEFHLSDTQLGFLAGLAYAISFSIAAIPLGMLADRVNRAKLLALLIALWSALTTLSGFATGYRFLLGARIAVGLAEAGGQPTSLSIIGDYVPPRRRAMAANIFMSGIGVGTLLGLSATAAVAAAYGWRMAFLVVGPIGLVVAVLVLLTLREPREQAAHQAGGPREPAAPLGATYRFILSQRGLVLVLVASMVTILANAGISVWMTPMLMRTHSMNLAHAGYATALVNGAMTLAGGLFGAWMNNRLAPRGLAAQVRFGAATVFVAAVAIIIVAISGSFAQALAAFMLWGFAFPASHGVTFGMPVTLVRPTMRGVTVGTLAVLNNLIGYGLGPVIIGRMSDLWKPAMGHDSLSAAVLTVGIGAYMVAALLFLAASRKVEADFARVEG